MTDREKAIITAYTGITMLTGDKFSIFHKYIEDIMGRPIWTHELANPNVWDEIKEKSRDDFLRLCAEAENQNDLISREALKKTIKTECNPYGKPTIDFESGKKVLKIIDNAPIVVNEMLTSERPQGEWIPVSERLPDEETDVLICNIEGEVEVSRGSYSTELEGEFIWYTSGWIFGKVVAWQPLPKPFKKGSAV